MLPHPQARGLEYAQHAQMDHLQAHHLAVQQQQQRMAQNRQNTGGPPPQSREHAQAQAQAQMQMQYQREMQQQQPRGVAGPGVGVNGMPAGARVSVAPPQSQQPQRGPMPLAAQPIPPSHPSHPQHQQWLAQQHRHQQQQQLQQQQQNGMIPPSSNPQQGPLAGPPGHALSNQHAQMSMQAREQTVPPYGAGPPNQGSIAPQARSITSAVNLRNGHPQPPLHVVNNGPFSQPAASQPQQPPAASAQNPALPPATASTPSQSPISIRPPSNQIVGSNLSTPQQQQAARSAMAQPLPPPASTASGQRPILRAQMNPQSQQASLALAVHLAVHGTGPVSATAVPTGTALARLLALTDALTFALEDEHPLDSLRTVVSDYFTDAGVVKFGLYDKSAQLSKVFEIPCSAFPRFQHLNLLHGVLSSTLSPSFIREYRLTTPDTTLQSPSSATNANSSSGASAAGGPSGASNSASTGAPPLPQVHIGYLLRADEAVWTSRFSSGTKVDLVGTLTVHLVFKDLGNGQPVLRVESFEFESRGHEEWVVREAMELIRANPAQQQQHPATPGPGNAGGGGNNTNSDSSTTTPMTSANTTMVIKEEGGDSTMSSPDKSGAANHGSRRSSNGGGQNQGQNARKGGMTTRRRSASAREELDHDQESNEDPSNSAGGGTGSATGDGDKDKERRDESGGTEGKPQASSSSANGVAASEQQQHRRPNHNGPTARIPPSSVGAFGVTEMGMRCLEISESVAQLQDLISFSLETNIGPIQSLAQFAERRRNSLYGGPTTPSQPPHPALPPQHSHSQMPAQTSAYGPPRPSQQPNNAFYSSVPNATDSPHALQTNMGPPPQRPPTAGSPATTMSNLNGAGAGGGGELMSPVALGPNGNGKRKLGNAPPGGHADDTDPSHGGNDPGSPQKVMRGAGGNRGRGRGR